MTTKINHRNLKHENNTTARDRGRVGVVLIQLNHKESGNTTASKRQREGVRVGAVLIQLNQKDLGRDPRDKHCLAIVSHMNVVGLFGD